MLGQEIRRARKKARMSQEDLGFEAKVDRTYVSMLERGQNNPTLKTFFRICIALNIRPSTIVRRIEPKLRRKR